MDAAAAASFMTSTAPPACRILNSAGVLLGLGIFAAFAFRSVNDLLWADELLTMHLLQADSLRKLWGGIALGIDGNPPLYLTGAWLLARLLPGSISAVAVLKLLNLALVTAGLAALWHLGRRVASAAACWAALFVLLTLNENLLFAAFEFRTYATYFAAAAVAALAQQGAIERGRPRETGLLALAFLALTSSHTFGIAYVGCIALAGWLSARCEKGVLRRIVIATAPSVMAVLAWLPILREQLKVASPYGWMTQPGWSELAETLFSSQLMLWICVAALLWLLLTSVADWSQQPRWRGEMISGDDRQSTRYMLLLATGFTAFALAAWIVSLIAFPIFVPRFFIPQLIATSILMTVFAQGLLAVAERRRALVVVGGLIISALVLRNVAAHVAHPAHGDPVCTDAAGTPFEAAYVTGEWPVITDSPHVFLPRAAYAAHREAYRFPLDWDVVTTYPTRSRGNAVDYHILQALQTWLPMPQVVTTDEVVRGGGPFLVIETPGRAWFAHLRATRSTVAEQVAQSAQRAGDDVICTLWKVTDVKPR